MTTEIAKLPLDTERAHLFALLGRLTGGPPTASLLARLKLLRPIAGELGPAYMALRAAAAATKAAAAERDYDSLFGEAGRGGIPPCASAYLPESPLPALRADLARLGVGRAEGVAEPEDHIAVLCETYAGLLAGAFPAGAEAAPDFFARHLRPWAARLFAAMEQAEAGEFYRAVGRLGRVALEVEAAGAA